MEMKSFVNSKIVVIFILCSITYKCVSASPKIYSIESDKVCSRMKKPHIHLGKFEPPTAIVTEIRYFDTWLGDKDFTCKFKVETSSGSADIPFTNSQIEGGGVFAVIQNLTLRMDEDGHCVDFIQFKQYSGFLSQKFCGTISHLTGKADASNDPVSIFAPNAFLDPSGRLEVIIYVAKGKLEHDERIDFFIVFTSYSGCSVRHNNFQPCLDDDSHDSKHKYCISKDLYKDGYVNCPFPGCVDEGGCKPLIRNIIDHGNGTAVTVGALAVIILVFVCFLAALWVLRKLHILCWSTPVTNRNFTPAVQFSEDPTPEYIPSAPSVGSQQLETPDKDPPPTYDSLFPPKPSES